MTKIITDEKKIDELLTRGVEDVIEKEHLRKALLSGKQLRVKLGIDPTSPDLHLGHAVVLRKLKAFQDLGHKVIFLVGDFTAQIGDPTGRVKARPTLSAADIKKNMKGYFRQAGKIIDLRKAELKYNSKWLSKIKLSKLLQLTGLIGAGEVLQREDFRKRMESTESVRVNEILYPIMEGIDSIQLKADVELGGKDQLLNKMISRNLMGKMDMEPQDILTTSLLEGTDGGEKMSKSLGNYIGLNDSADDMYGKLMSIKDELIKKYLLLCTDLDQDSIDGILEADANPKNQKSWLAFEVVKLYHGAEEAQRAQEEFGKVFSDGETPSDVRPIKVKEDHVTLLELVMKVDGVKSKSEARRIIGQGGVKINGNQVMDANKPVALESEILLQVGKRRFAKFTK